MYCFDFFFFFSKAQGSPLKSGTPYKKGALSVMANLSDSEQIPKSEEPQTFLLLKILCVLLCYLSTGCCAGAIACT